MTVGELRNLLEGFPSDLRIGLNGYEGGVHDVFPCNLREKITVLNVHTEGYYGPHDIFNGGVCEGEVDKILMISRLRCPGDCDDCDSEGRYY